LQRRTFDPQALLKRIEKRIQELDPGDINITVSGAGCPSSCGIAHLSDIGFHGVMIPVVDPQFAPAAAPVWWPANGKPSR
jgi:dissimilatory sulfite reductase (desulfoviridin) alpha/beta subunit